MSKSNKIHPVTALRIFLWQSRCRLFNSLLGFLHQGTKKFTKKLNKENTDQSDKTTPKTRKGVGRRGRGTQGFALFVVVALFAQFIFFAFKANQGLDTHVRLKHAQQLCQQAINTVEQSSATPKAKSEAIQQFNSMRRHFQDILKGVPWERQKSVDRYLQEYNQFVTGDDVVLSEPGSKVQTVYKSSEIRPSEEAIQLVQQSASPILEYAKQQEKYASQPVMPAFWFPTPDIWKTTDYLAGICLFLGLAFISLLAESVGFRNADLDRADVNLETALALPLPIWVFYLGRVLQRTFFNLFAWFMLTPLLSVVLITWNFGWWTPPTVVAIVLLNNLFIAIFESLVQVKLRSGAHGQLTKNIQALASIISLMAIASLFALSVGDSQSKQFLYRWLEPTSTFFAFFPTGLALIGLSPHSFALRAGAGAGLFFQVSGMIGLAYWLTRRLSARGLEIVPGLHIGPRKTSAENVRLGFVWKYLSPILAKDITLLRRDRVLLIQTMIVPIAIAVMQVFFNYESTHAMLRKPAEWSLVCYGVAAYTLLMLSLNSLLHEKEAIWLLFTVPKPIARLVADKVVLWSSVASLYGILAWIIGICFRQQVSLVDVWGLIWLVIAIPMAGIISVSIGALNTDPLATDKRKRIKPSSSLLVMFFAGNLGAGLLLPTVSAKLTVLAIFSIISWAIWRRMETDVDLILDPDYTPPKRLEPLDGLIALVIFYFLQVIFFIAFSEAQPGNPINVTLAFAVAGVLTILGTILTIWWRGTPLKTSLSVFGRQRPNFRWAMVFLHLFLAGVLAVVVASVAMLYLYVIQPSHPIIPTSMYILIVVFAPLIEEFLFRGLLLGGMRERLPNGMAIVMCAGLFALIHPTQSVPPVFLLGLTVGWLRVYTGGLLAPILCHGFYNFLVVYLPSNYPELLRVTLVESSIS